MYYFNLYMDLKQQQEILKRTQIQEWIRDLPQKELNKILLSGKEVRGLEAKTIARQWHGLRAMKTKHPELVERVGILYPPKHNLEQCSSLGSAKAKLALLNCISIQQVVDITGGWGLDALVLSKEFDYCHIEQDLELQQMAALNFDLLGLKTKTVHANGLEWIKNSLEPGTLLYADPQRRDANKQRFISWENYAPSPQTILENLNRSEVEAVLLKLSPMEDLKQIADQVPGNYPLETWVVQVKGEVKEILALIKRNGQSKQGVIWVDDVSLLFYEKEDGGNTVELTTEVLDQLHIPEPAFLKAAISDELAFNYGYKKLDNNSWVYTSTRAKENGAFRNFRIKQVSRTALKKFLKPYIGKHLHVISKNYPLSANEISARFKLKPGGEEYLICTTQQNENLVVLAEKIP
ncbi:MAG: THUMP-like domain-containing protein [Luteibaculum sp.]